jgi:hypothetical protein
LLAEDRPLLYADGVIPVSGQQQVDQA